MLKKLYKNKREPEANQYFVRMQHISQVVNGIEYVVQPYAVSLMNFNEKLSEMHSS
jgi:hypothetical protein